MNLLWKLMLRAGIAPLVITPVAPFFFDTADSTDTTMTGRTGWTAGGDSTKAGKMKSSGDMFRMTTGTNGDSPYGFQVTTNSPIQNRRVTFEYDYSQQGGTLSNSSTPYQWYNQRFLLAWQDATNYLSISPAVISGGVIQWRIYRTTSDADVEIFRYMGLPMAGVMAVEVTEKVRLMCGTTAANMTLRVPEQLYTDATAAFPDKLFASGSVAVRTGPVGLRHTFHPLALAGSVKVEELTLRVDDPKEFYGRNTATNSRAITFTGTYVGTPVSWAYRLRRRSDGATVRDWTAYAPTYGSGTFSGPITVPTGGPYYIDIAWVGGDGQARIYTPHHFAVGILIVAYGQSNALNMTGIGGNGSGYGGNDQLYGFNAYATFAGSSFRRWMDDLSALSIPNCPNMIGAAKALSDALVAAGTPIPVGVAAIGFASNALATLKPGTANYTAFQNFVTEIGGYYENVIWSQGEAEGLSLSSYATYPTDYASLVAGFKSAGGNTDVYVFNRIIGSDALATNNSTTTTRSTEVRKMLNDLANGTDIFTAAHPVGKPKLDELHYTNVGTEDISYDCGLTIAKARYGLLAYDGRGPLITSAARSGAVITCSVNLNGTSGISGNALTGYEVSNDDFATLLPQSSATVTSNQIVITLSSTPTGTVKVRSFAPPNYDQSSLATGSLPGSRTVAVFPILTPITVT